MPFSMTSSPWSYQTPVAWAAILCEVERARHAYPDHPSVPHALECLRRQIRHLEAALDEPDTLVREARTRRELVQIGAMVVRALCDVPDVAKPVPQGSWGTIHYDESAPDIIYAAQPEVLRP